MDLAQEGLTGGPPALNVQLDADKWQELISAQDEFVADLLAKKLRLHQQVEDARDAQGTRSGRNAPAPKKDERAEQIEAAEARLQALRTEYQKMGAERDRSDKMLEELEARLIALQREAADTPAARGSASGAAGTPITLVLIDGNVAPFADHLIEKGQPGGKDTADMLEEQVHFDPASSETTVLVFLLYERKSLVSALSSQRVISAPSTWKSFIDEFSRRRNNFVIEVNDSSPAEVHMTAILLKFGYMSNVERIFIAGTHPGTAFRSSVPKVGGQTEHSADAFVQAVLPKVVLIKHAEDAYLGNLKGPTVSFAGLFASSAARPLGSATRPVLPDYPDLPSAAGKQQKQQATSGNSSERISASEMPTPKRKVDPNRSIIKQDPVICFHHYLTDRGCMRKTCALSHDYELSDGQMRRLREEAARYPCSELRKTGKCTHAQRYNELCMFSHEDKAMAKWKG